MFDLTKWRPHLISALAHAIEQRGNHEKRVGYSSDSAMLASWKQALKELEKGG